VPNQPNRRPKNPASEEAGYNKPSTRAQLL